MSNNKATNFFVQNEKIAWGKRATTETKFGARNFHVDTYKQAFSRQSYK